MASDNPDWHRVQYNSEPLSSMLRTDLLDAMLELLTLRDRVKKMRIHQRRFFQHRDRSALQAAKMLETEVDCLIDDIGTGAKREI